MSLKHKTLLPARSSRRYRISLTPLADAMFQLLIFFMLSSNITPYSLLPLKGGAKVPGSASGAGTEQTAANSPDAAIWTIENAQIKVAGQIFAIDRVADLTQALALAGTTSVVLIVRPEARVQDMTSVLEALSAGGIVQVKLANGGEI